MANYNLTEDQKHILRQLVRGHEDGKLPRTFYVTVGANVGWVFVDWKGDDRPKLELIDLQVLDREGFILCQVTGRNKRGMISTVQCTLLQKAFEAVRTDFSYPAILHSQAVALTESLPCAVILTALPVEYQAIRAHLTDLHEETHPQGTVYEWGNFSSNGRSWKVAIVEIEPGNPGAAMEAERAINHFNPSVALFVGVAGGIKDVALGDVVAATKAYGYESGKAEATFQTRPDVGNSTYRMIQRAKTEARKGDWLRRMKGPIPDPEPRVFIGPIAAGEKVVASTRSAVYKFLQSNYSDALAVEMEGHGFLKAVHANSQVDAMVIRGISDLIEGKKEADAAGSQETAARHASAFAFEILAKVGVAADFNVRHHPVPGDVGIELDRQRESTLQVYFDQMTELLEKGLRKSEPSAEVRTIARARTRTALSQLDGRRKGVLLQFLYEAELIGSVDPLDDASREPPIIHIGEAADLKGLILSRTTMWGIELELADLNEANLRGIDLYGAVLRSVDLSGAVLSGVNLCKADLRGANLRNIKVSESVFVDADLQNAKLQGADLKGADLRQANLKIAKYDGKTKWPEGFDPISAGAILEG